MIKSKLLRAYEFELMDLSIQCDQRRCTKMATKVVVTHRLDTCDKWPNVETASAAGNSVLLLCDEHTDMCWQGVRSVVDRMTDDLKDQAPLVCTSCGKIIQNYGDAITLEALFDVS